MWHRTETPDTAGCTRLGVPRSAGFAEGVVVSWDMRPTSVATD